MADSDSGTHVSDITEPNTEENESKNGGHLHPITEGNNIPIEVNVIANNDDKESKYAKAKNAKNHQQEIDHISHSSIHSQLTQSTDISQKSQQRTAGRRQPRLSRSSSRTSDVTAGYVTAMNVHNAPRVYRKLNGDLQPLENRVPRRQRSLPPSWNQNGYVIPTRIENIPMNRSLDSFQAHGHSRTAYEFMDASRRQQKNDRRVAIGDLEIEELDERNSEDDTDMDDAPWTPTGIFSVFIITLWTAVLKLIDSIDNNGPVICSEGEEVRLWICSGCLSLVFFLAEIVWKEKNFTKALFGAVLVFSYMMLGHAEPLTCRLGEEKLNEINKWQAAMNFFFAAVLGTKVYQEIAHAIRKKRKKAKKQKPKRNDDDSSDDDESVMKVYRV